MGAPVQMGAPMILSLLDIGNPDVIADWCLEHNLPAPLQRGTRPTRESSRHYFSGHGTASASLISWPGWGLGIGDGGGFGAGDGRGMGRALGGGSKYGTGEGIPVCPDCGGFGVWLCPSCNGTGEFLNTFTCTACKGRGMIDCDSCHEEGA